MSKGSRALPPYLRLAASRDDASPVRAADDEIVRLFNLPDQWLGAELLRIARLARQELPDDVCGVFATTYERRLLAELLPEVARRLGATLFPSEATSFEIRTMDDVDLRVSAALLMYRLDKLHVGAGPNWRFLMRDVAEGSIIAIALDRVSNPAYAGDFVSSRVYDAWSEKGVSDRLTWGPELSGAA